MTARARFERCAVRHLRRHTVAVCLVSLAGVAAAQGPAYDCSKADGSIETLVCGDAELGALDRTLASVYAAARAKAGNEHPPVLRATQRGWIKGRNDCWKAADRRACVSDAYRRRIAELQARYRLLPIRASATYVCNGDPANEIVVNFFQTDPPTLIAERGDSVSLMFQSPAASGARYEGRNESLWEHQGEATVVWGYGAPELRCTPRANGTSVGLTDTTWALVAIQSMDDAQGTTDIADPSRYTVRFATDGRASFRLDCNRGTASWSPTPAPGANSGALAFGPIATTRAQCPAGSLAPRLERDLPYVRSYSLADGRLSLSLMADGGIYEWRPTAPE